MDGDIAMFKKGKRILKFLIILATAAITTMILTIFPWKQQSAPKSVLSSNHAKLDFLAPLLSDHKKLSTDFKSPYIVKEKEVAKNPLLMNRNAYSRSLKGTEFYDTYLHNSPTKFISLFNPPSWLLTSSDFSRCEFSRCKFVSTQHSQDADIVIFHGVNISVPVPPPRPPGQIWIVMGNESPVHYTGFLNTDQWRSVFNWTMTTRVDSDVFAPYSWLMEKENPPSGKEWLQYFEQIARSKTRLALSLVSNCKSSSAREEYLEILGKHIPVDAYGYCGRPVSCRKGNKTCTRELFKPFVFSLAFENSLCKDYVTEKFFRFFGDGYHTIPVVRGGADYARYFPKGTFINTEDFKSPADLAYHLVSIARNATAIAEILLKMSKYKKIENIRQCEICQRLHVYNITKTGVDPSVPQGLRQTVAKSYRDVFQWMLQGMCYQPKDVVQSYHAQQTHTVTGGKEPKMRF